MRTTILAPTHWAQPSGSLVSWGRQSFGCCRVHRGVTELVRWVSQGRPPGRGADGRRWSTSRICSEPSRPWAANPSHRAPTCRGHSMPPTKVSWQQTPGSSGPHTTSSPQAWLAAPSVQRLLREVRHPGPWIGHHLASLWLCAPRLQLRAQRPHSAGGCYQPLLLTLKALSEPGARSGLGAPEGIGAIPRPGCLLLRDAPWLPPSTSGAC